MHYPDIFNNRVDYMDVENGASGNLVESNLAGFAGGQNEGNWGLGIRDNASDNVIINNTAHSTSIHVKTNASHNHIEGACPLRFRACACCANLQPVLAAASQTTWPPGSLIRALQAATR
jgi:hypothetical protein